MATENGQARNRACTQAMAGSARAEASGARVCAAHGRGARLEYQHSLLLHA